MRKVKLLLILMALLLSLRASTGLAALVTLDFEGLPNNNYYWGGNQNIGGYYPGVTFGPDATILDQAIYGYNSSDYPPHSGDAVFFTDSIRYVDITFDTPTTYVEGWFTFFGTGSMLAYDALDNLLDSDSMSSNIGSNTLMSVAGTGIKRVRITDAGDFWTGDDISYESEPIPEPGTLLLLSTGLAGLAGYGVRFRRKRKA